MSHRGKLRPWAEGKQAIGTAASLLIRGQRAICVEGLFWAEEIYEAHCGHQAGYIVRRYKF